VGIGTDYIGICKSNYHTITITSLTAVVSFLICDNVLKQKYFVITDVEASKKRMGINIAFHDDSLLRLEEKQQIPNL
jgi:hypothetical protein